MMSTFFKKISALLVLTLISVQPALAGPVPCVVDGEMTVCPDTFSFILWPLIVVLAFSMLTFIFWLWMLIDAIKNQKEDKVMWILLLIFLNFLGAILYYFIAKRKEIKSIDK